MLSPFRIFLTLSVLLSGPIAAGGARADIGADEAGAEICEAAIVAGAHATGVPQEVLHAISLTETGRAIGGRLRPWPWAINREGQGFWFADREQAMAFARSSLADGRRSFDVGCFQINYHYQGHRFLSLDQMFDPVAGAIYAGRFLADLYAESGNWSLAAGAYHSRTPHYAQLYRTRFDRIRSGIAATPLIASVHVEASPKRTGRSRVKMARKPLIITVDSARAGERSRRQTPQQRTANWNLLTQVAFDDTLTADTRPSAR
jgi:hypothetical protein